MVRAIARIGRCVLNALPFFVFVLLLGLLLYPMLAYGDRILECWGY